MSLYDTLLSLDIERYKRRYCLVRNIYHIDETYFISKEYNMSFPVLMNTRCIVTHDALSYLLNSIDRWTEIDGGLNDYRILSINLQCEHIGHIFLCVRDRDQWYMISSYANEYSTRVQKVDMISLFSSIDYMSISGIDDTWNDIFSCQERCISGCIPRVSICGKRSIMIDTINDTVERIDVSIKNGISHIYCDIYSCLL